MEVNRGREQGRNGVKVLGMRKKGDGSGVTEVEEAGEQEKNYTRMKTASVAIHLKSLKNYAFPIETL